MKHSIWIAAFVLFAVTSCDSPSSSNVVDDTPAEYVILQTMPDTLTIGGNWYNVVDIATGAAQGVPVVIQLDSSVHGAWQSFPPTFRERVVRGQFIPDTNWLATHVDTLFRVTAHVRDTIHLP